MLIQMSAQWRADVPAGSGQRFGGNCYDAFISLHRLLSAVIDVPQEPIRHDNRACDICMDLPLSVESARSVRDAAIAIRYHGARYLPVVDDGCLVGIVAFREQHPAPHGDPDPGPDTRPGHGATNPWAKY